MSKTSEFIMYTTFHEIMTFLQGRGITQTSIQEIKQMGVWDKYNERNNADVTYIKDLIGETIEYLDHKFFIGKKTGKEEVMVTGIWHDNGSPKPVRFFAKSVMITDFLHVLESSIQKGERVLFRLTYDETAKDREPRWGIEEAELPSHVTLTGSTNDPYEGTSLAK